MENTVIEVLNKEHGKKVIQYFKDLGITTGGGYTGSNNKKDGDNYRYYGVINGYFNHYPLFIVEENECKIITLPKEKEMKTNTITKKQLEQIYNIACSDWKTKIYNYATKEPFADTVRFSDSQIEEMFKAATKEQLPVLTSIFGERKEDKNAFLKNLTSSTIDDSNIGKILFGSTQVFQLLHSRTPDDRPELYGRAFYVFSDYKVETGKLENGGTWISIYKK